MFPENNHLVFGFSLRRHQNMSLLYGDTHNSLAQRRSFLAELGIDYRNLISAKQVHSSNIRYVKKEDRGRGALTYESAFADTDGLVTDTKNLPLAV
ncbi:MAG: laccase domain-containing protein, partial [Candidatus Omnitrophica bacterium]|nr:laccase domain-containing protein [Candidatus Omnitrophota bacterium]